jgi:DNA gyrase subunit B
MARNQDVKNEVKYDESTIIHLDGIQAVRKRPGMYVGGTDLHALHHLVYEVVDNSIDEALGGYCDTINVTLRKDGGVTVSDDGRGIPVGIHPTEGISTLQLVMTELNAGGKFGGGGYKVSGGLHGVGVTAVNALSRGCEVEVRSSDGYVYRQRYKQGIPLADVEKVQKHDGQTGTTTTFWPDPTIFPDTEFKFETLMQRFREMAFVTRGVTIHLRDERTEPFPHEMSFYFEGGIASFVRFLNRNRNPLHAMVYGQRAFEVENVGTVEIEFALQYADYYTESVLTFANTINTTTMGGRPGRSKTATRTSPATIRARA